MPLTLKNPHSVLAALASRPGDVMGVTLASDRPSGVWAEVLEQARVHGVPVRIGASPAASRKRGAAGKSGREGANEAAIGERPALALGELFTEIDPDRPDLWIALDRIQDPHNLGAIFRTAGFFGARGLVITRDRSAPLSAVVYDTAAGGVEAVPFARPANLRGALEAAKKAGLWVLGSSEHAPTNVFEVPRDRPWLLVLGNEMSGMRRLTAEHCDMTCRLPSRGNVASLNVSVAAGALIAALTRP